ncbi:MAG: TolC family protein [Gemmatimonadota bacterium]|nr:TolC family protein [Gemmatimonadota bacterium]
MIAVAFALALQAVTPDTLPLITLEEALRRGTQLDPSYVVALGQVRDASWQRTAAIAAFVAPAVTATTGASWFSSEIFNIGTGQPSSKIVSAQLSASYDLFRGGGKLFDLQRRRAEFASAEASEVEARFRTALFIESDFYDVLAQQELVRVAEERVRRAGEQLGVARARVLTGGAVQTDSLQLVLELNRARVDLLRQRSQLRVARLQLGRRVGSPTPVGAAPVGPTPPAALPITEEDAVAEALGEGPAALAARADARAASAAVRSAWSLYLPSVTLTGQVSAFDVSFFPNATTRSSVGFTIALPIWNNGQREIALSRARSARAVAEATRRDTELAVRRDVVEAYEAYRTARASFDLAEEAVTVARENLRVQDERYRAGATTILDLVIAQVDLAAAEADLVQARYATRLALAGMEALLGRRLTMEGQ